VGARFQIGTHAAAGSQVTSENDARPDLRVRVVPTDSKAGFDFSPRLFGAFEGQGFCGEKGMVQSVHLRVRGFDGVRERV
jgi:hypothetical protein